MRVVITGAAGYVGSVLVAELLKLDCNIIAIDTFWFGENSLIDHPNLKKIKSDICELDFNNIIMEDDIVVHLACISNDPSFDLDISFSKKINFEASYKLINICNQKKIKRFIYASSSSVYGLKNTEQVTEDLSLEPITPYAFYKAEVEKILKNKIWEFDYVILRPATVCGLSPRLRLDVVVNMLTAQAYFTQKITVFGGNQFRPQLHIHDMVSAYILCIFSTSMFQGEIYNVGEKNYTVFEIAQIISQNINAPVNIVTKDILDNRSYRLTSKKFLKDKNFSPKYNVQKAIVELIDFFNKNKKLNWQDSCYHNVLFCKTLLSNTKL